MRYLKRECIKMKGKILVAGAGHGGLSCAANLAKSGFDVTVLEKQKREKLGYDWDDVFFIDCLDKAGFPKPDEKYYHHSYPLHCTSPNKKDWILQDFSGHDLDCSVDRKYLLRYMISFCEECGVKFIFEAEIASPITDGARVTGVKVKQDGLFYDFNADLVIDACGMNSTLRRLLPNKCGIINNFADDEYFTVYRALYERNNDLTPDEPYNVYFYHNYEGGADWVLCEEDYIDVLVGRFGKKLTREQIDNALADFRKDYSSLGDKIVRGGQINTLPIRRMIPMMVCDSYAAIGDSAGMTIPLIGSGIANSIKAGKILADVIEECDGDYSRKNLWQYEYRYFNEIGKDLVLLDIVRKVIISVKGEDVDFMLNNKILTSSDISMASGGGFDLNIPALAKKGAKLLKNLDLVAGAAPKVMGVLKIKKVCDSMPKEYDEKKVGEWIKEYTAL